MPIGHGFELKVEWRQPELIGDAPRPRSGHTLTQLDESEEPAEKRAMLFGGLCEEGTVVDTVEILEFTEQPYEWTSVAINSDTKPAARQKHTATLVGPGRVLIFAGRGGEQGTGMNDCWLYDDSEKTWEAVGGMSEEDEANAEAEEGSSLFVGQVRHDASRPAPRSEHTANLIGENIFIFGGYGGHAYARRDFNDLFTFNVGDEAWAQVKAAGEPPAPRSGHTTSTIDTKLFVGGGWSATGEYNDLHIFDTLKECWSTPEDDDRMKMGDASIWNHCAVGVWAVPSWKMFTFGGHSG